MRVEAKILLSLGTFFGIMCAVYWNWSLENAGGVMMFAGMLLCFLPGSYYYWWSRRMKARPEDDPQGTQGEGAGVIGSFPGSSIFPFTLGMGAFFTVLALVFGSGSSSPASDSRRGRYSVRPLRVAAGATSRRRKEVRRMSIGGVNASRHVERATPTPEQFRQNTPRPVNQRGKLRRSCTQRLHGVGGVTSSGRTLASSLSLSANDTAPGTWGTANELSTGLNYGNNASIYSISCSEKGYCSAGGNYTDVSGYSQGFVTGEANGSWGGSIEVPGLAQLNSGGNAYVASVSCSSVGNCGAAGSYADSSGDIHGFVVSETSGSWGAASEIVDPSAVGSTKALGAESISCTATGDCTAVGDVRRRQWQQRWIRRQ